MTLNIHFNSHEDLRDAIAYEFYMDNIGDMINGLDDENADYVGALYKLAKSAYAVAEVFVAVREEPLQQQNNEPSAEES